MSLRQGRIEEIQEEIKEAEQRIEDLRVEVEQARLRSREMVKERSECERRILELDLDIRYAKNTVQVGERDVELLMAKVEGSKRALEEDAIEKEILKLIDEQPCFWDAVEARLTKIQNDLKAELGELTSFIDPKTVIEKIRRFYDQPRNFSQQANDIRAGIIAYDTFVRDICEMKHRGKPIPLSRQKDKTAVLDRFLHQPSIEAYWSQG